MPPMRDRGGTRAVDRACAGAGARVLALLLALGGAPVAEAGPPGPLAPAPVAKPLAVEAAKPAEAPAPEAIPLPSVIRSAEEASRSLRQIGDKVDDDGLLQDIDERLPRATEFLDRVSPSGAPPTMSELANRDLGDLRQALLRSEQTLSRWDGRLEDSVRSLHESGLELKRMDATWALTEEGARRDRAPEALLQRIATLRAQIGSAGDRIQVRLGAALQVQDRVASLRLRIGDWLAAADLAEKERELQLFEIESAPLWRLVGRPAPGSRLRDQVLRSARLHATVVHGFAVTEAGWLAAMAAAFALLALAIRKLAVRFRARAAEDPALRAPAEVLRHPVAVAFLLTLSATPWVFTHPPITVSELVLLAMLPAFLRAMARLMPAPVRRSVYAFTAVFAASRLGALLPENSLLGRLVLVAVAGASVLGLVAELRRGAWAESIPPGAWRRAARLAGQGGALLFAGSVVANVVGNVSLAQRLANGTLASVAAAVLLVGIAVVLQALWVGLLHMPGSQRLGVVARHGDLLASRGAKYIRWAAVATWVLLVEGIFRVTQPRQEVLGAILARRLRVGGLDMSLGDVAAFAVTLWISVLLARFLSFALEEGLEGRGLPRGVPAAISKTVTYAVTALGCAFAFLASGMDMTRFTVLVGTLGVGIGFGLQNIVNNFVSGLILLYERPVQVGDIVEVGKVSGVVRRIGIRSSTIRTFPGAEVVVPNANLISGELVNWTLSDGIRRVDINFGVAYGSDPDKVIALAVEAARASDGVSESPPPSALFTGFGESALEFQLRFWTARYDSYMSLASDVRVALSRRLAEAGIAIPFPQRDLRVVSVDSEAARVLREAGRHSPDPDGGTPGPSRKE